jgi:hypothetical protein
VGGAAGKPTGASVGNGTYTYSASYDNDLRLASSSLTYGSTTDSATSRSYDAVGNVASLTDTVTAGTDHEVFCYDEQNRLTWAANFGTSPCQGAVTGTTVSTYDQTYTYDAQNRLTDGSLRTHSYGDSAHLHAATALSSGYTASYDAAGDMVCRAPTSSTTCVGTQTGGQYTYANERRMVHWQTAPGSGVTPSADEGYDGDGTRVEDAYHTSSSATTLYLAGGLEEVGTGGTLTKYYPVAGLPTAVKVGSTLSYLATDGLGTITVAMDGSGLSGRAIRTAATCRRRGRPASPG